jgi:hypothetical protein
MYCPITLISDSSTEQKSGFFSHYTLDVEFYFSYCSLDISLSFQLFIDVTWSAGGSELDPSDRLKTLEICANAQEYCCLQGSQQIIFSFLSLIVTARECVCE